MARFYILILFLILISCQSRESEVSMNIQRSTFQRSLNGKSVDLYRLAGDSIEVLVTNYGGRIVALNVPDNDGNSTDVVLGFPSLNEYLNASEVYHGALIGRFANRISKGIFQLNGQEYKLAINNPPNSLHGGPNGFHNVVWDVDSASDRVLKLSYLSPDMEEGYPGNVKVNVTYRIQNESGIEIHYSATTDKSTVLNLTSHPFFNLNGEASGDIGNHFLKIDASKYSPVDSTLIPLGAHEDVEGTPFDFRDLKPINQSLGEENEQLRLGLGYDHNFVLDKGLTPIALNVAQVYSPDSNIKMWVYTTEPGLQFYGGNFLNGSDQGKSGKYKYREAFCLESQHFPDSPNRQDFPTTVLNPGETFESVTRYRFGINQ